MATTETTEATARPPTEQRIRGYLEQAFREEWPSSPAFIALEGDVVNELLSDMHSDLWSIPDQGPVAEAWAELVDAAATRAHDRARRLIIDELVAGAVAFVDRCPNAPLVPHTDDAPPRWERRRRKAIKHSPHTAADVLSGAS